MWLWSTCVLCHRNGPSPCAACVDALRPLAAGGLEPLPNGLDGAAALCRYEGIATGLVTSLKFRHHRDAVGAIGAALAVMGGPWLEQATVCWVPAAPANRARRGFDQGELLATATARAASDRLGQRIPSRALLRREPSDLGESGQTPGQTGRTRVERLVGPVLRPTMAVPHRVVVIDDVTTTGTSLERAAMALRSAGAGEVYALCVAATPVGATVSRVDDADDGDRARRPGSPHR